MTFPCHLFLIRSLKKQFTKEFTLIFTEQYGFRNN